MKPIIEIKNIAKKYRIGKEGSSPYLSLRDSLTGLFSFKKEKKEDFWALNDVSLSINPGESIGVIGRNGAGKSTLLKVLSKITPPTRGEIILRGRVASLLEVGTGFHPELTGRENVFLNGSILGLKKKEISKHFDSIVDFSGVEKFLDTPLKHYSSGMQLRLAFAVAAHLEPEILVIDEVLAVGDSEFQKKCIGKMDEVSKSGRTVIFVSHNMGIMQQLCGKIAFLKQGTLMEFDQSEKVIKQYLNSLQQVSSVFHPGKTVGILSFDITNDNNDSSGVYHTGEKIKIKITSRLERIKPGTRMGLTFYDQLRRKVFISETELTPFADKGGSVIEYETSIPALFLTPGVYTVSGALHIPNIELIEYIEEITAFEIIDQGNTPLSLYAGTDLGSVFSPLSWNVQVKS